MTKPAGWRNLPKHFCLYIRATDDQGNTSDWVYDRITGNSQHSGWCGNQVSYRMVLDDDDNRVRRYSNLCNFHLTDAVNRGREISDE